MKDGNGWEVDCMYVDVGLGMIKRISWCFFFLLFFSWR